MQIEEMNGVHAIKPETLTFINRPDRIVDMTEDR